MEDEDDEDVEEDEDTLFIDDWDDQFRRKRGAMEA